MIDSWAKKFLKHFDILFTHVNCFDSWKFLGHLEYEKPELVNWNLTA